MSVMPRLRPKHVRGFRVVLPAILVCVVVLCACKVTTDAAAAAKELGAAAQDLSHYYKGLADQVEDTIDLNQIEEAVFGVPFGESDQAKLLDIKKEIDKRGEMAKALSSLAEAYGDLAGSKIAGDAGTAASALGDKLVDCKALPSGSPVPEAMSQAATLLTEYAQSRDLKRGAKAIQETVAAVDRLFETEKPYYVSLTKTRLVLAATLAGKLVDNDQVDLQPVIAPALKPFGLQPKLTSAATTPEYKKLAKIEIEEQQKEQTAAAVDSANDLEQSLKRVDKKFADLVAGKTAASSH